MCASTDPLASSIPQAAETTSIRRSKRVAASKDRPAEAGERRKAANKQDPSKTRRSKPRVRNDENDENASPNAPALARRGTSTDSPASSIAQVSETTSTRRSPRVAAANNRGGPAEKKTTLASRRVDSNPTRFPEIFPPRDAPEKRARPNRATLAETRARVAPAAPRARVAEGHAGQDPEFVLTHGPARKKVKEYEPFMQDALKNMLKEKIEHGNKTYVAVAKKDENGKLTVNEKWLGVPLERNCELPSDTGSGPVGVALCTYNAGTTNGARGTLGKTPFALQKAGYPANLSMRFLMRTIPRLGWYTNKRALLPRFRGWRKFADAYGKRFGMFDLVSIALPKVGGVTIELMKFMKGKDINKFNGWVLATADYFETFLGFCGGASNARGIINSAGMTPSSNPWIFFLCELRAFAPKHAVVAYLQRTVDGNFIMPHASAIVDGRIKVGVEKLRRGDEALTKMLTALFVDEKNGLSLRVHACYDLKLDRENAREAVDSYDRKEKELARKAEAEAEKAEKAEKAARAKAVKAARKAARKAEKAASAKERKAASDAKRNAKPEVKKAKAVYSKAYDAKRNAKPEVKKAKAVYNKAYYVKPEAKKAKAVYNKAYRMAKAAANAKVS